jgi:hypothetical protein
MDGPNPGHNLVASAPPQAPFRAQFVPTRGLIPRQNPYFEHTEGHRAWFFHMCASAHRPSARALKARENSTMTFVTAQGSQRLANGPRGGPFAHRNVDRFDVRSLVAVRHRCGTVDRS